jgi:hypothetical protein
MHRRGRGLSSARDLQPMPATFGGIMVSKRKRKLNEREASTDDLKPLLL